MRVVNQIAEIRTALMERIGDRYTQVAVAKRLGVATWTLSRWESGEAQPRVLDAINLARDLGVTVEQLGFRRVESPAGDQP
jgi:DNA-binding XRE family transcriptional regulator